jgi:hypothetical protein
MMSSSTKAAIMVAPLRDGDVRAAAMIRLLAHARRCSDTLVIDELGLSHGAARVDIAIINGHIRGVEIKAEADTLERLPRQAEAYGRVVDKATLIASERHLLEAEKMVPQWWGLIGAARARNGSVVFRRIRTEHVNRDVDPVTLARLLWRTEAASALSTLGCEPKLLRAPRAVLYQELVDRLPRTKLAALVRSTLKARSNWRDRPRFS